MADIAAAEAAAVVEGDGWRGVERVDRESEAVAGRVWLAEVGVAGGESAVDGEGAEGGLHGACRGEGVSGEAFGAADEGRSVGVGKHGTQGEGFGAVSDGGGGGVGVDVVDLGGGDAGIGEGSLDGES